MDIMEMNLQILRYSRNFAQTFPKVGINDFWLETFFTVGKTTNVPSTEHPVH